MRIRSDFLSFCLDAGPGLPACGQPCPATCLRPAGRHVEDSGARGRAAGHGARQKRRTGHQPQDQRLHADRGRPPADHQELHARDQPALPAGPAGGHQPQRLRGDGERAQGGGQVCGYDAAREAEAGPGSADQAFLIHFDREVELLEDFTTSRDKLHRELDEMGPTRAAQNDSQGPETSGDDRGQQRKATAAAAARSFTMRSFWPPMS